VASQTVEEEQSRSKNEAYVNKEEAKNRPKDQKKAKAQRKLETTAEVETTISKQGPAVPRRGGKATSAW
jgi:hypothetical protein